MDALNEKCIVGVIILYLTLNVTNDFVKSQFITLIIISFENRKFKLQ